MRAGAHERPVYGALNFRRKVVGGAPRFGSAHFRLAAETLARTTFCYPDSFLEPSDFGVAARMGLIELALADRQDELDDYVEAQVHGPVRLQGDVEALVLDPCYRGTTVEAAALRLGCPVEWHPGFRLGVGELRRHPATAARNTSTWAREWRSAACSIRGSSEMRDVPAATIPRRSRRCGITWHASERLGRSLTDR